MRGGRILVIDDELDIARLVALHLRDLGFEVQTAGTVAEARVSVRNEYDLVVLDLMLPDGDGLELCRELRARDDYTPVLILTARTSETDRVVGLELGADDYLVKPFSVRELVARVKAILRRVELAASIDSDDATPLEVDGLCIEPDKRRVRVAGRDVDLTATEFDLLLQLASHPGRVYTRNQLLDLVWGADSYAGEHTVNAHVNRLRSKVEPDPTSPHYVRTVWGVGYRFLDPRGET